MDKETYAKNFEALRAAYPDVSCDVADYAVVSIRDFPLPACFKNVRSRLTITLPGITDFDASRYSGTVWSITAKDGENGVYFIDLYEHEEVWDGEGDPSEKFLAHCSDMRLKIEKLPRESVLLGIAKMTEEFIAETFVWDGE